MIGFAALALALFMYAYVHLRTQMMRRGYHYCHAPGCRHLHPPEGVRGDTKSFLLEYAEDVMEAQKHKARNWD